MGYWNIDVRCPHCGKKHWLWDEEPSLVKAMEEEWLEGYKAAEGDKEEMRKMSHMVESMRELLAANARVLRQEIREEIELANKKERQDETSNTLPPQPPSSGANSHT